MNQPTPTGPDLFGFAEACYEKARAAGSESGNDTYGSPKELYHFRAAEHNGRQAQTAALVMLAEVIANASGVNHRDFEGWREKIGITWIKECWGKEIRRPQCEDRHTEDCAYADPVPEPKHVLLDVGTRVLVSEPEYDETARKVVWKNPYVGRVAGYDMHRSKYQINEERYGSPGEYYDFVRWAFVDNRVQVHPDGPEYTPIPAPEPVKQEPTGPRMYVENLRGKQGHIVDTAKADTDDNDIVKVKVRWYVPGASPVWVPLENLNIIPAEEVDRCENGQTGDECGSGENRCELCLQ